MTQIPSTVTCPYLGFETFAVTYNMMATQIDIERMTASIGEDEPYTANVIVDMTGWPEAEYPGGPFAKTTPMLVTIWTLRIGFQKAMAEYINSPFSMT